MAQSLARILLHLVFSTKNRENWIPEEVQPRLHAYLAGACRGVGSEAFRIGGTDNHVHIACSLPRTLAISKLVEEIKKSSSAWMKKQHGVEKAFAWQAGYGAFSLGYSQLPILIDYINHQEKHHRQHTFKEEFIDFLNRYGIEHDERYVWE